jgi:glycosyltransferase involved in cell wall biosynthesis
VYPSIHREPFGMVAAEAMSFGTPVLVPDLGGITEVIAVDGRRGGLSFAAWDSRDLADQLQRLLTDDALRGELAANARGVAEHFSVKHMTDNVLAHMGISPA